MFPSPTRPSHSLAACLLAIALPLRAEAAPERLSDLSAASYHQAGADTVQDTTGRAKLEITFMLAQMVRVQVAPTGEFSPNPSPATVPQRWPAVPARVTEANNVLIVRSADLTVQIARHGLRVAVYGDSAKALLTGDASDGGARWDLATGQVVRPLLLLSASTGWARTTAKAGRWTGVAPSRPRAVRCEDGRAGSEPGERGREDVSDPGGPRRNLLSAPPAVTLSAADRGIA